ncbi:unnamed protein product [Trichobilharzia szidati]|nr:unnamed protein product [Trichobilharzia szidati]
MSVKGGDRLTPFMAYVRNLLLGRKYNNTLRYAETMSKRTQPPAFLPNGVNDKLSSNDYYTRDGRREVRRPSDVYVSGTKRLTDAGRSESSRLPSKSTEIIPGEKFKWDKRVEL